MSTTERAKRPAQDNIHPDRIKQMRVDSAAELHSQSQGTLQRANTHPPTQQERAGLANSATDKLAPWRNDRSEGSRVGTSDSYRPGASNCPTGRDHERQRDGTELRSNNKQAARNGFRASDTRRGEEGSSTTGGRSSPVSPRKTTPTTPTVSAAPRPHSSLEKGAGSSTAAARVPSPRKPPAPTPKNKAHAPELHPKPTPVVTSTRQPVTTATLTVLEQPTQSAPLDLSSPLSNPEHPKQPYIATSNELADQIIAKLPAVLAAYKKHSAAEDELEKIKATRLNQTKMKHVVPRILEELQKRQNHQVLVTQAAKTEFDSAMSTLHTSVQASCERMIPPIPITSEMATKAELEAVKAQMATLLSRDAARENNLTLLQNHLSAVSGALEDRTERLKTLEAESKATRDTRSRVEKLETAVGSASDTLMDSLVRLVRLEERAELTKATLDRELPGINDSANTIKKIQEKMSVTESKFEVLEKELDKVKEDVQKTCVSIAGDLEKQQTQIAAVMSANMERSKTLKSICTAVDELKKELKHLETSSLASNRAESQHGASVHTKHEERLQKAEDEMRVIKQAAMEMCGGLKTEMRGLETTMTRLEKKTEQTFEDHARTLNGCVITKKTCESLETTVTGLEVTVAALQKKMLKALEDHAKGLDKYTTALQTCDGLEKAVTELKTNTSKSFNYHAKQMARHTTTINDLQKRALMESQSKTERANTAPPVMTRPRQQELENTVRTLQATVSDLGCIVETGLVDSEGNQHLSLVQRQIRIEEQLQNFVPDIKANFGEIEGQIKDLRRELNPTLSCSEKKREKTVAQRLEVLEENVSIEAERRLQEMDLNHTTAALDERLTEVTKAAEEVKVQVGMLSATGDVTRKDIDKMIADVVRLQAELAASASTPPSTARPLAPAPVPTPEQLLSTTALNQVRHEIEVSITSGFAALGHLKQQLHAVQQTQQMLIQDVTGLSNNDTNIYGRLNSVAQKVEETDRLRMFALRSLEKRYNELSTAPLAHAILDQLRPRVLAARDAIYQEIRQDTHMLKTYFRQLDETVSQANTEIRAIKEAQITGADVETRMDLMWPRFELRMGSLNKELDQALSTQLAMLQKDIGEVKAKTLDLERTAARDAVYISPTSPVHSEHRQLLAKFIRHGDEDELSVGATIRGTAQANGVRGGSSASSPFRGAQSSSSGGTGANTGASNRAIDRVESRARSGSTPRKRRLERETTALE